MKYVVLFVRHLYKPFRTIWVDQVGRGGQGRSKSAPEWPESGFGAVQRPPNWSMNPEMDPKCFPQLPVIDSSPFPDLLKHYSLYILKNINYLILSKILISEISTLAAYRGQLSHFLNSFVIFLSIPYDGILRKITKPFKKWLSWPWKMSKVTCIFYRIFG